MSYESKFDFARDNPAFWVECDTADRTLWLRNRRKYLGASDAAAILGENPWSSELDVYADHIGVDQEQDVGEPAYWGTKLQPVCLAELERRTGRPTQTWEELCVSKERSWQSCTMDGLQFDEDGLPGGVEIKCTRLHWNWNEGLPPYVYAQIQHQYSVTNLPLITLAVLFNGNEFYWKDVERDDEYVEFLNEKELAFWNRLLAFEAPDPDSSEASKQALARLYPRDNGKRIVFPPEFTEVDAQLIALKDEHKDIGTSIRGLENQIKAELKDATSGICTDGTIYTHKGQTRKAHEVEESTFRVLRRKGGKIR